MRRSSFPSRFAAGLLLASGISLGIFYLLMHPRESDLGLMALVLTTTSAVGLLIGYLAFRQGWIGQAPSIRWALLLTYLLPSLLIFLSLWITARLMFVNQHDLLLATILLLFAGGIALAMGSFFSDAVAERVKILIAAVREVRDRGLGAKAQVPGRDEIAELAQSFNDMTERLQHADARRSELERARRDLIAWVSHDLQTPLASIRAMIEALADDMVQDPQTVRRYLRTAQREVLALSLLIDDLFEMARLDAGGLTLDLQPNSIRDLVSDTVESFSAMAAEKGVKLHGEVAEGVDLAIVDAGRMSRVLANLVSNAMRHTPSGGEVYISACAESGALMVEVSDTGEGISGPDSTRLFERFYRGEKSRSRATGGAGLGLAIARGFIEAHGGEIRAEPRSGGGARFIISLPMRSQ